MLQLKFEDVTYSGDGKEILSGLTVDIEAGSYISVVGPSGSGKSTFLKLCSHLVSPTKGRILFYGKDFEQYGPTELRKRIRYCFQTPVLFGDTVEDNLRFPYSIRRQAMDRERIEELFARFCMDTGYLKQNIRNLSGGEKQRIALIRTLLFKPEVLLLDEVTSALDADNSIIVEKVIEDLNRGGITVIWVTHNLEQSIKYADKRLTLENGKIFSWEALK